MTWANGGGNCVPSGSSTDWNNTSFAFAIKPLHRRISPFLSHINSFLRVSSPQNNNPSVCDPTTFSPSSSQGSKTQNIRTQKKIRSTDGASHSANIRARVRRGDAGRDAAGIAVCLALRQLGAPNGEPVLWLSPAV